MASFRRVADPPVTLADPTVDPTLERALAGRWSRRLTVVTGAPATGKTTALALAVQANLRAPVGVDAWVSCQPEDRRDDHFGEVLVEALRAQVGGPSGRDTGDVVSRLRDLVWARAPVDICLVLDDVHLTGADSRHALLRRLLEQLPENGHLLLASRSSAVVGVLTAAAGGDVTVLGEHLLGGPGDAGPLPVVPAGAREIIRLLGCVGPLDDDEASHLLGRPVRLGHELQGVPFLARSGDRYLVHDRWAEALRPSDAQVAQWRSAALTRVRAAGDLDRALRLAVDAGDRAGALEVLADGLLTMFNRPDPRRLAWWLDAIPHDLRDAGAAVLARALLEGGSDRSRITDAALTLRREGQGELELVALARLGLMSWKAGDLDTLHRGMSRVTELRHLPLGRWLDDVGVVMLADLRGDTGAVWEALQRLRIDEAPEPGRSLLRRYQCLLEHQYGSAHRVVELTEHLAMRVIPELRPDLGVVRVWALWHLGRRDQAQALLGALRADTDLPADAAADLDANLELLRAWRGEPPRGPSSAPAALEQHGTTALTAGQFVRSLVLRLAAVTRLVMSGHEDLARDLLARTLEAGGAAPGRGRPALLRVSALVHVLLPAEGATLAAGGLGTGPTMAQRCAASLLAARSGAIAHHDPEDPEVLLAHLPPVWAVELALRASAGTPEGAAATDRVVEAAGAAGAAALEVLRRSPDVPLRRAALAAHARLGVRPTGRFVLRLLGPVSIEQDGRPPDHGDWRRERVRALFALLAQRHHVSRAEAGHALWPDLDADAAANNLRVTLSYLQRTLEPDRPRAVAPFHVRADPTAIRFAGRDAWVIDVVEFEQSLERARVCERDGDVAGAVAALRTAMHWYRGSWLADLRVTPGEEVERDRLRSRFVGAAVRLASLLAAAGDDDDSQRLATRALEADPWSEEAAALVIRGHLSRGDRPAAARQYARTRALLDDLGLPPSERLTRLGRDLHRRGSVATH